LNNAPVIIADDDRHRGHSPTARLAGDTRTKEETGAGHSRRRPVSDVSFQPLRHSATSLLKNAGVPESVAMDIIGHDSSVISRHYTHIEASTKRAALKKLPDIPPSADC